MTLKNLLRRPRRTVLTLAGIALGAATYMALLTAGRGLLIQFRESATILGSDVVIQQVGVTSPWHSTIPPGIFESVSELPGISGVSRMILGKTRLPGAAYFFIFGIDVADPILGRLEAGLEGRLIERGVVSEEILMGRRAALRLDLHIGDLVDIRNRRFKIVGVYETGRMILDNGAVMDLIPARGLFGPDRDSNLLFLDLADPELVSGMVDLINRRLPEVISVPTVQWIESYGQIEVIQAFSRFLALIALIIAMLGVSNVLHISVSERSGELAILRAIGWSPWSVASLVLSEGVVLTLIGGLLGIPLAEILLLTVGSIDVGGFTAVGLIPLFLPLGVAFEGVLVCVLAGGIGSLAPLVRALRLHPGQALRSL